MIWKLSLGRNSRPDRKQLLTHCGRAGLEGAAMQKSRSSTSIFEGKSLVSSGVDAKVGHR
jgi:hypothetical protein